MSRVPLLEGMFPPVVQSAEASEEDVAGTLCPEEEAIIQSATPIRRREFTGSRSCARRLMRRLSVTATTVGTDGHVQGPAILNGTGRAPVWPEGLVGTISHTAGRSVVAVARANDVAMLGVDIERCLALGRDLWPDVFTPEELRWLLERPPLDQGWIGTLLFSAKECGYKAQFPHTQAFLDFREGRISVSRKTETEGTFQVGYPPEIAARLPVSAPQGCWAIRDGLVVTALSVVTVPLDGALPPTCPQDERRSPA